MGIESAPRILVVDDEASIRLFLKHGLRDEGYEVELAASVEEAIAKWQPHRFDMVMLDKNLPDGTGLDLARRLSSDSSDCALVLMSGYANLSSAVEAMQYSVADYFVKPFDLPDLLARLRRVLEHLKLERHRRLLVGELKAQNELLADLSIRDHLTQLHNHAYLQDSLQKEVLRSRRHGQKFGLLFVDLDRFKEINDSMGHLTGDRVLTTFAEIVTGKFRRTDSAFRIRGQDVASRYGGDEFALMLPETDKAGTAVVGEHLRSAINDFPFEDRGLPRFTISVGAACFPEDGEDRVNILDAADAALYAAKRAGRNTVVGFTPSLRAGGELASEAADAEVTLLQQLEASIADLQFRFVYQPVVDTERWEIYAYEALCRPANEAFKHIGELIETAERTGKVTALGRALRRVAASALPNLVEPNLMFINLHPQELNDPQLSDPDRINVPDGLARRIVFEVTETEEITNMGHARDVLTRLRERGFRVALDDLGSGYSGFSALTLLEPDYVKLDMGLVRRVRTSARTARLVKHLVEFCGDENAHIIAEGIETLDELTALRDLGVKLMQGYYFARPEPPFTTIIDRPTTSERPV